MAAPPPEVAAASTSPCANSLGIWRRDLPLYELIKHGQGALALVPEILAEGSVNINAVDEHGLRALDWAIRKGYTETAALLITHGKGCVG